MDPGARERDDAWLIAGLAAGEPVAAEAVLERAHRPTFALAAHLTRQPDRREEWTHVALLQVLDDLATGRAGAPAAGELDTWVGRRVRARLLEMYRNDSGGQDPPSGTLPESAPSISPADEAAEWASRARLIAGVRASRPAPARRAAPAAPFDLGKLRLPAAAAAALIAITVFLMRRPPPPAPRLGGFEIASTTSPSGARLSSFRASEPFVLRMVLPEPGVPVIVTVARNGAAELLYPAAEASPRALPAGPLVLPDSSLAEVWTFPDGVGDETFFGAFARPDAGALGTLRDSLDALNARSGAGERELIALIERNVGPVVRVSARRLP